MFRGLRHVCVCWIIQSKEMLWLKSLSQYPLMFITHYWSFTFHIRFLAWQRFDLVLNSWCDSSDGTALVIINTSTHLILHHELKICKSFCLDVYLWPPFLLLYTKSTKQYNRQRQIEMGGLKVRLDIIFHIKLK